MTSSPHDHADDADLAEQQSPVGQEDREDEGIDIGGRDDADEGDLLEQATPVPEDDDDHRGTGDPG
jgi:hypothetical protein